MLLRFSTTTATCLEAAFIPLLICLRQWLSGPNRILQISGGVRLQGLELSLANLTEKLAQR